MFAGIVIVRFLQPSKALEPMLVTLFGMVISVRQVYPLKALSAILSTPSKIIILLMLEHVPKADLKLAILFISISVIFCPFKYKS